LKLLRLSEAAVQTLDINANCNAMIFINFTGFMFYAFLALSEEIWRGSMILY